MSNRGRKALWHRFLDKAQNAMVAALEIYNKPQFQYREETFAILAINAWELLLKAKILSENKNDPKSIREYEARKTKQGKPSKIKTPKRNRSGNPTTISLHKCMVALDNKSETRLDEEAKNNLFAIIEVRDNAVHYVHASPVLAKHALELSAANVANFVILAKRWFNADLTDSFSLVLPLSFAGIPENPKTVAITADEQRLLKYLQSLAATKGDDKELKVALRVDVKFHRSPLDSAIKVRVTDDPDALNVKLSEENIRQNFKWTYENLLKACRERYQDFKENKKFHQIRKPLHSDTKIAHSRRLDPDNPRTMVKIFYSPNIIKEFDKHYKIRA